MSVVVDTSILIDHLRGEQRAADLLTRERAAAQLHASEITRLEVLAGMRPAEEEPTRLLLSTPVWHDVNDLVAEKAGARWDAGGSPAIRASTAPTWPSPPPRS